MFPSGFHPGEKIGGDWTCVAEDIVMPLGSNAPLTRINAYSAFHLYDYWGGYLKSWKPIGTGADGEVVYFPNGATPSGSAQVACEVVKVADLSSATNAKLVSIWKRS